MAIAGLRNSPSFGTPNGRKPETWREGILHLYPFGSQRAPLAALTALMKSEATTDANFHWFQKKYNDHRFALAADLAGGSIAGNVVTMTLTDGAFGLKAGDTLMVEQTGEILYVSSTPTTDTAVSVVRGMELTAGSGVTAVTYNGAGINPWIKKIGSAYEEGSAAPDPVGYDPVEKNNQTQIFRESYGMTGTAMATKTRTGDEIRENKQDCLESFTESMEMAFWFGKRRSTTRNGQPLRFTDGIFNQLPAERKISLASRSGAISLSYWESLFTTIFRYGSNEKMAFCGSDALLAITQMVRRNSNLQWQLGTMQKEYGMDIQRLVTPLGTLVLKHHPMFSQMQGGVNGGVAYSSAANQMAILDMSNLKYRYMQGRDVQYQTNYQLPGVDAMLAGYIGEVGLELNHTETHMLITGLRKGIADADDPDMSI